MSYAPRLEGKGLGVGCPSRTVSGVAPRAGVSAGLARGLTQPEA